MQILPDVIGFKNTFLSLLLGTAAASDKAALVDHIGKNSWWKDKKLAVCRATPTTRLKVIKIY